MHACPSQASSPVAHVAYILKPQLKMFRPILEPDTVAQARATEQATREPAAASLKTAASRYLTSATSDDPKLAHIAPDDKQKVCMIVGQLPADQAPLLD